MSHFAPENCNYRFTAIWYPCLSLPIRHWCQSRFQFLPWWMALTSCRLSMCACHYATRLDKQRPKHCTEGLGYKWSEGWGSTDSPLKRVHNSHRWMSSFFFLLIFVTYGLLLNAVVFVHMSAQMNVHHFQFFVFFLLLHKSSIIRGIISNFTFCKIHSIVG